MGRTSPVVAQFEFAARVRKRREELGLPAAVVSKHLGFTRNFYSAVENSRSLLATAKLPLLIEALQFDDADAQTLTTLLEQARTPGWWQAYSSILDDALIQFLGLEYGAAAIRSYESLVFSGLLQAPEYAAAIINSSLNNSPLDKRRILEVRMRRQAELFKGPLPKLRFLFGEGLLYQQFGEAQILKSQLQHVLHLAEKYENEVDIRLRPFKTTPVGLTSASTLVLLDFHEPDVPTLVYREAGRPLGISGESDLVDRLDLHYEQALTAALDRSASLEMIHSRLAFIDS